MGKLMICPWIKLDLPEPYLSIVTLLFYTVYQEDFIQGADTNLAKSNIVKNIVNDPAKVHSSLAKLLVLNEMFRLDDARDTLHKLPLIRIQRAQEEYTERRKVYEEYINESFSTAPTGIPGEGDESATEDN